MKRLASFRLALPAGLLAALVLPACLLIDSKSVSITYDLDPQEFSHDFSEDGAPTRSFPSVPCADDTACAAIDGLPRGWSASCDAASSQCVGRYDLRLVMPVNLSQQKGFPTEVASAVVQRVEVRAVRYWAATNTLDFATPPIDVYVGGQSATKETDAGTKRLGTVPTLPAMTRTDCAGDSGSVPGTRDSACALPLTSDGKDALATLAKSYKTPFNVLAVAHLEARGGDPMPDGRIDLYVQPSLAFVVPFGN